MTLIRARLALAAEQAGRSPAAIRLVAVTKTVAAHTIREAAALGVDLVGENRVQDAIAKQAELQDLGLTWHLIGHLQTNKVAQATGRFALMHSVDSLRLLEAIDARARHQGIVQQVLLQVNVALEASKGGFRPDEVEAALTRALALDGLAVRGLMTIAPWGTDPEDVRPVFRALRVLRDRLVARHGVHLDELSMGMSGDMHVAVAEGATLVRIGTGIFGERPRRPFEEA